MSLFKSSREKRFWIYALMTISAIYATIPIARPIATFLREERMINHLMFWCFIVLVVVILIHSWKSSAGIAEIAVWFGIIAIYLMMMMRMTLPEERTHLVEYSIVALLIHEALKERVRQEATNIRPALYAFLATAFFGIIDECIQAFFPSRVFDFIDIGFNSGAAFMAIVSSLSLDWARRKITKEIETNSS